MLRQIASSSSASVSVQHGCSVNRFCAVPCRVAFSAAAHSFPHVPIIEHPGHWRSDQEKGKRCADCACRYSYNPDGSLNAGKFRARFNWIGFNCNFRSVGWYGSMNALFWDDLLDVLQMFVLALLDDAVQIS